MTKLSGSLPKGEANGLGAIARGLLDEPHKVHVVIALIDCSGESTNHDTGDRQPTARIRRIEAVLPQDHATAETLLRRSLDKRYGRETLPFDLEADLKAAFDGVDVYTGEMHRPPDGDDDTDGSSDTDGGDDR